MPQAAPVGAARPAFVFFCLCFLLVVLFFLHGTSLPVYVCCSALGEMMVRRLVSFFSYVACTAIRVRVRFDLYLLGTRLFQQTHVGIPWTSFRLVQGHFY